VQYKTRKKPIQLITRNIFSKNQWLNENTKLPEIKQSINPWPQPKTSRKTEITINRLRISHTHDPPHSWTVDTSWKTNHQRSLHHMRSYSYSKTSDDRTQISNGEEREKHNIL